MKKYLIMASVCVLGAAYCAGVYWAGTAAAPVDDVPVDEQWLQAAMAGAIGLFGFASFFSMRAFRVLRQERFSRRKSDRPLASVDKDRAQS